jgi:hypothetical protein
VVRDARGVWLAGPVTDGGEQERPSRSEHTERDNSRREPAEATCVQAHLRTPLDPCGTATRA